MRITFPQLTKKRLRWLLEYPATSLDHIAHIGEDVEDPADAKLLRIVQSLQRFNLDHRQEDYRALYRLFDQPGFLEPNSEGTTFWLANALAIKDLCSLTNDELQTLLYSVY